MSAGSVLRPTDVEHHAQITMRSTVVQSLDKPHDEKHKRGPHVYARELPAHGSVRLETVLTVVPVGKSTWWNGIKDGRHPVGVKLGLHTTARNVNAIRALLERTAPDAGSAAA